MTQSVDKTLRDAAALHKAGRIAEAIKLYQAVLTKFPKNPRALKALAMLKGVSAPARPGQMPLTEFNALKEQYQKGNFIDLANQAQGLANAFPKDKALLNLLGSVFNQLNQAQAAITLLSGALRLDRFFIDAQFNLGIAHQKNQDLANAIACFQNVIELAPNNGAAHFKLANAFRANSEFQKAILHYKKTLTLEPNHAPAHCNLGLSLQAIGDIAQAIRQYQAALKIDPKFVPAQGNLGNAMMAQGAFENAIKAFLKTLKLQPENYITSLNLGRAYKENGDFQAACNAFSKVISMQPEFSEAHNDLGLTLYGQGKLETALKSYQKAVDLNPNYADAYNNMGVAQQELGAVTRAIESYQKAIAINPNHLVAYGQKMFQQASLCDWSALQQDRTMIATLGVSTPDVTPWNMLGFEDHPMRHLQRSKLFAEKKYNQKPLAEAARPAQRAKPVRIGYFSADFHDHATMYLMARVFEKHSKSDFEIYAYSYGPNTNDCMRKRLTAAVDKFHNVRQLSDFDIAALARDHEIDIAVDLKGYTQNTRLGIFAFKAAPIQISYIGYPGSLGAPFIDYIIADPVVIPRAYESAYSEKIIFLPHSYQANDDMRPIANTVYSRSQLGLPADAFVLCCFNNSYKITPCEFDIWMRVLSQIEGSVLWLLEANKWVSQNLRNAAQARGIDPSRLIFAPKLAHHEHLARHSCADLFIDTFNVNAHTTASDALWAGLPLVTKAGKGFAARVAASLLTAIGLPELIVETEAAYEALILDLARSPQQLQTVTEKLAQNRRTSPLFDAGLLTNHLETGYRAAYQRWVEQKPPAHIRIAP